MTTILCLIWITLGNMFIFWFGYKTGYSVAIEKIIDQPKDGK